MAKYIYTITKGSPDEIWMTMDNEDFLATNFSQTEMIEILKPYRNFIHTLPGFQSTTTNIIDSVNMEVITVFDTLDNANNAMKQMAPPFEPNSIQDKNQLLLIIKRKELGVNYTYAIRIEE